MQRSLLLAGLLSLGFAAPFPAAAQTAPADLVKDAVAASGGAEALRALKGLAIKAEAKHWEPEQSAVPGGEAKFLGDSQISIVWDLEKGQARTEWDRDMKYPAVVKDKFTEVVTPALGWVVDDKGQRGMSGIRIATQLRELQRASPTLLLKAMDAPQALAAAPDQKLGADTLPAVTLTQGATSYTILFDRQSKLPAAIRTLDDDNVRGDQMFDLVLADWQPVGAAKVARSLTYRLGGTEAGRVVYKEVTANPTIAADAFQPSDAARQAAKPPATGAEIPYQWVQRRLWLGRFTDSDAVVYDAASSPGLKLVELAPNVQQVVGGTHNSLVVAMKDQLVVFDAPIEERQSRWTIDAAKEKYPGKPIGKLVLTHHHMDHTGGTRAFVAEGAEIVVGAPGKAHWDKVLANPRTVRPDAQQKSPRPVKVTEVSEVLSIKDETGEVRIIRMQHPHAEGMVIGHVVGPNLVFVTDAYSPGRDRAKTPNMVAFAEGLKSLGLAPAIIAGGHGTTATMADLEKILASN
jgi:glyoxylase-like metal-dependent hydrolase (beta-lactamase superfamily II)